MSHELSDKFIDHIRKLQEQNPGLPKLIAPLPEKPPVSETYWEGDWRQCQNPGCPNGHLIAIAIFRGSGYCSDNCRKALGLDPTPARRS